MLALTSFYLPSYKAGGPVKTIRNMVEQLQDCHFSIATRDRDLCDKTSFSNVDINSWQTLENAAVIYLSPDNLSLQKMASLINGSNFDVLYLNSFFDFSFSIKPLLAKRAGLIRQRPVVLAPRGEFSAGAMALKPFKKKLFIMISKSLGLHRGVVWQASSELEKQDIVRVLGVRQSSIFVAKDLPSRYSIAIPSENINATDTCRLIFLSRISPMKNLDFALQVLAKVKSSLVFNIYGPIEDEVYWGSCLSLIEKLPANISVNYCGSIKPDSVADIFSSHDLFLFPTRGENYGHVIAESLSVGTPVLLSDQTPWQDLAQNDLGWDLPLDLNEFAKKIETIAVMDKCSRLDWRKKVLLNALSIINNEKDISDNYELFNFAMESYNRANGRI
ncbi:glycosyltransferase family 4 protein [Stutzerimonas zhaodongensis]|uniref:glycosyltransferase family 4 protein n=1 Tax=Stutzerimonas TaxID=2901164 RepID=UPI00388EECDD